MKKLILISFNHRINSVMARATESNAVGNFKAKLGIISPRLNVVGNKFPSSKLLATALTGILISVMDFSLPDPILRFASSQARLPILVVMRTLPIHRVTGTHSNPREVLGIGSVGAGLRAILPLTSFVRPFIIGFATMKAWFISPLLGPCFAHQPEYNTLRRWCQWHGTGN